MQFYFCAQMFGRSSTNLICYLFLSASRDVFRYQAVLMRDRFDQNKDIKDLVLAKSLLEQGEQELFKNLHWHPKKCKCYTPQLVSTLVIFALQFPIRLVVWLTKGKLYPLTGWWTIGILWKKPSIQSILLAGNSAKRSLLNCGSSSTVNLQLVTIRCAQLNNQLIKCVFVNRKDELWLYSFNSQIH